MIAKDNFLHDFSQEMTHLLPAIGTENFAIKLADLFKALFPTNNIMIIFFPKRRLPTIAYNDAPPENRSSLANRYIKGAFLLDPFYLAARREKKEGLYALSEVVPARFEESEYNSTYFKHSGLTDECSYLIQVDDSGERFVIVSLGIIDTKSQYNQDNLEKLASLTPLIKTMVKNHWQDGVIEQENQMDMRGQLETALEEFGSSILTDRENQTVQMILHGHSNRGIAEKLNISIETVKLHRKNAYSKLDLGSQGELFNLFINSLMNIDNYSGGDPLVSYLSCPQKAVGS